MAGDKEVGKVKQFAVEAMVAGGLGLFARVFMLATVPMAVVLGLGTFALRNGSAGSKK